MVPSHYQLLTRLPRTPNNKIDRRALAGLQIAETASHEYVAPRAGTETTLAAIWVDVLRVSRVGATDNFFDSGGHSLLATRVLSRVNSAFGVRLRVRDVFALPTLAEFARHIETVQWISHGEPAELLDSEAEFDEESF
jgi:acyl carrier protein